MRALSLLVVFAVTAAGQGRALALGPGLGTHEHWSSEPTPQLGDGSRLELTPHHRLYSATRGHWVAAGELGQEALRTQDGTTQVTRTERVPRPAEVFNLEVFGTERYLVGQSRTLAHNSYAARGVRALPAPRQIEAAWSASTHRHGGLMTGIEHIMYRHSATSGFANVSRFASGTRAHDIAEYVDETLRYGGVAQTGPRAYMVEHGLGRTIGTNIAGAAASSIRVFVRDGIIQTAFPF